MQSLSAVFEVDSKPVSCSVRSSLKTSRGEKFSSRPSMLLVPSLDVKILSTSIAGPYSTELPFVPWPASEHSIASKEWFRQLLFPPFHVQHRKPEAHTYQLQPVRVLKQQTIMDPDVLATGKTPCICRQPVREKHMHYQKQATTVLPFPRLPLRVYGVWWIWHTEALLSL